VTSYRVLLALALTAACAAEKPNNEPISLHARSLGPLPLKEDVVLFDARDIAVLDSTVYVADAGLPGIQAFALDGRRRWAVGRKGGGPLEFRAIVGISVLDGRIAVADSRNGRVTIVDRQGALVADVDVGSPIGGFLLDNSGRFHLGRHRQIGTGGTVQVLRDATDEVGRYGRYEARDHSVALALHNGVALARGDHGDVWVLYPFRGLVLHVNTKLEVAQEWLVPLPEEFDPEAPYVREMESPQGAMTVAIVRAQVASDIAMDDRGHVLVARSLAENGTLSTQLLIYDQDGRLREVASLPVRAKKIAWSRDTLYTLDQRYGEPPSIGRYVLGPGGASSR